VSRRLVWALIIGIAVSIAALIARNDHDPIANLLRHDTPSLIVNIVMGVFIIGLALTLFRNRLALAFEAFAFWAVIALLLFVGYTYRFELREVGERVLAEIIPGRVATVGRAAEIVRGQGGDFGVQASINGARVAMVVDTGATSVVLTQDAAKSAGLPLDMLAYTVNVDTANGRAKAAPVILDRLAVGGVTERNVPALIAQPGQLRTSLLGMSFLNRLESWEVRGDKLRMRAAP
jgi:aspartyl protease family protein